MMQVNSTAPKGSYGKVEMNFASTIFASKGMLLKSKQINSVKNWNAVNHQILQNNTYLK